MINEQRSFKGELILNTNFGNGYAVTQRNDEFVVIDITGEEFAFSKFESVCRFIHSTPVWNDSRILVYNEIKAME